jgi:metacaspase-1
MAKAAASRKARKPATARGGGRGAPGKITLEELHRKLANPKTTEAELRKYVVEDEERSGPFTPRVELNKRTVVVPPTPEGRARGEMAIASLNWWCRQRRLSIFNQRIASGYKGPIIVSEGDSWFQYPIILDDTIDQLLFKGYAIRSLDAAGDTLENMIESGEYLDALRQTGASVFLFSAGGNDILGGGNLAELVRNFDPALTPAEHILPGFQTALAEAVAGYDTVLRGVESLPGDILILCHGYDRPLPNRGKWLGKPMEQRGIRDKKFQAAIAGEMIDRFNAAMSQLLAGFPNARHLDMRGIVGTAEARWHDELHPVNAGYKAVADIFDAAIRAAKPRAFGASPDSTARPSSRGLPKARLRSSLAAKPAKPAGIKRRRGLSLHVGLNRIDANHYGSDGALAGCIADAEAMRGLAKSRGFDVMGMLIDGKGKRKAVIDAIKDAAETLKAGDLFLYTYSGHGSQLPDLNQDEADDRLDETWCLFDGMFLDDEAYNLWGRFREGVRVLTILDCCHSGTAIRNAPDLFDPNTMTAHDGAKPRMLPMSVAARAFRNNEPFYRKVARSAGGGDGGAMLPDDIAARPEAAAIRCSVRLISGCQDNQLSMDGFFNGRFTEELLKVWDGGRFRGNYRNFHKTIVKGMPPTQTPNHYKVGVPDPAFDAQAPFTI